MKAGFGFVGVRPNAVQPKLAFEPMKLWFVIHDAGLRDMVERLHNQLQSLLGLAGITIGLCQKPEPVRAFEIGSGRAIGGEPFAQLSDASSDCPCLKSAQPRRTIA